VYVSDHAVGGPARQQAPGRQVLTDPWLTTEIPILNERFATLY